MSKLYPNSESKMSLTTVEKNVFIYIKQTYFYMYPFPLKWDREYTRLSLSKPHFLRLIPFTFVIVYSFVYAIVCLLAAIYYHSRSNLKIAELFIFFSNFYALNFVDLLVFILSMKIHLCLDSCNETMQMANRIQNGMF